MYKKLISTRNKRNALMLALILVFSGCSINFEKSEEVSDWEDEVLLAQDCGLSGLSCCIDKGDLCKFGQECCFDPNDQNRHRCVDVCACGKKDSYCCEDNKCDDGLMCSNGECVECGDADKVCCANDTCNENLLCFENKCVECGGMNTPCCTGENKCDQDSSGKVRVHCKDDVCRNCGRDGFSECLNDNVCDNGFFSTDSLCLQCGGFNQPCCKALIDGEYECDSEKNLSCAYGFCLEEEK